LDKPRTFDPAIHVIGMSKRLHATKLPEQPDPPLPIDGLTIGIATMAENSPHGGEMHPDGDEVLYMISGHANVVFLDSADPDVELKPGAGLVVPQGMWHRVDILEPSQIVYATPGPNNEFRPLADKEPGAD
jgi:mannose-6-phosphate isomerase-like protein (cupin superfamily)